MSDRIRADVYNEDCITGMASRLDDGSVTQTTTSIPFEELFSYSNKTECLSNNGSTIDIREGRFALNLRFFIEQLFRVHAPGTNACIHIQQLLAHKIQHGFMGRRDFRGAVIDLFRAGGWGFVGESALPQATPLVTREDVEAILATSADDAHLSANLMRLLGMPVPSELAIVKDPQQMAQRLNLHSLQFKTGWGRSSTKWAMAPNDYVLIFQKPGEVARPVQCLEHTRNKGGWVAQDDWIQWARGVWDIDAFDVLDGARSRKGLNALKEGEDEKHVCPLQRELVRRLIKIYSNPVAVDPASLVLDPFMGIGTVAHEAILLDRPVVGFELKESYHKAALNNIERAHQQRAAQRTEKAAVRDEAPLLPGLEDVA